MATLALPISQLEQCVRIDTVKAKAAVRFVQVRSKGKEDLKIVLQIVGATIGFKRRLSRLGKKQERLINALVDHDFAHWQIEDISKLASSIDDIVIRQREIFDDIQSLGSEIRIWWSASLARLSAQMEHLDSIAASLHSSADPDCEALLALAIEQIA